MILVFQEFFQCFLFCKRDVVYFWGISTMGNLSVANNSRMLGLDVCGSWFPGKMGVK